MTTRKQEAALLQKFQELQHAPEGETDEAREKRLTEAEEVRNRILKIKPRPEKSEAFLFIRDLEAAERAHQAAGGAPRVFYHPGYSRNGILTAAGFQPHAVPEGQELDLDAWEAGGKRGAAPLRPLLPEPPTARQLARYAGYVTEEAENVERE